MFIDLIRVGGRISNRNSGRLLIVSWYSGRSKPKVNVKITIMVLLGYLFLRSVREFVLLYNLLYTILLN